MEPTFIKRTARGKLGLNCLFTVFTFLSLERLAKMRALNRTIQKELLRTKFFDCDDTGERVLTAEAMRRLYSEKDEINEEALIVRAHLCNRIELTFAEGSTMESIKFLQ